MLALQLLFNGLATGCALGVVAVTFSLVYSTTKLFHVAHAGVFTLGGYLAWSMTTRGSPFLLAFVVAVVGCAIMGSLIQAALYARLERRHATHLVILIASLGTLAVMQNIIAAVYTPNILQFSLPWASAGRRRRWPYPADRHSGVDRGGQSRVIRRTDVVRALDHSGQADARRRIEPVSGGDHPAAASPCACLRDGDCLRGCRRAGYPGAGRSGAATI